MNSLGPINFRKIELRTSSVAREGSGASCVLGEMGDGFKAACAPQMTVMPAKLPMDSAYEERPGRGALHGEIARVALLACGAMTPFTGIAAAMPSISVAADFGRGPGVSANINSDQTAPSSEKGSTLHDLLPRIPPEARALIDSLNKTEKARLMEKMSGKSRVGFFKVDNREAFIKGTAFGFDVFAKLQSRLDEKAGAGEIDRTEYARQTQMLKIIGGLAPEHREILVKLVELELR